jgi:hypothetical protein
VVESTNVADEVYDGLRKRLERVLRNLREKVVLISWGANFFQTTTVKRPQSNDHSGRGLR